MKIRTECEVCGKRAKARYSNEEHNFCGKHFNIHDLSVANENTEEYEQPIKNS